MASSSASGSSSSHIPGSGTSGAGGGGSAPAFSGVVFSLLPRSSIIDLSKALMVLKQYDMAIELGRNPKDFSPLENGFKGGVHFALL